MSDHDMIPYSEAFAAAAAKLGWECRNVKVHHERDDASHTERTWFRNGERLFAVEDLEEGMVKEIIRIASLLKANP